MIWFFALFSKSMVILTEVGYYHYHYGSQSETIHIQLNGKHAYVFANQQIRYIQSDLWNITNAQYIAFQGLFMIIPGDYYFSDMEIIIFITDVLACMENPFIIRGTPRVQFTLKLDGFACGFSPIFDNDIKWNRVNDEYIGSSNTISLFQPDGNKFKETIYYEKIKKYVTGSYYVAYYGHSEVDVQRRANYFQYFFPDFQQCSPSLLVCNTLSCKTVNPNYYCSDVYWIAILVYCGLVGGFILIVVIFISVICCCCCNKIQSKQPGYLHSVQIPVYDQNLLQESLEIK